MAMAVYENTYKQYTGELTPTWSRFLIIPRHAYQDIFKSKIFTAFFVFCFIYPLGAAIFIYLHHNANALAILQLPLDKLVPIDLEFFFFYVFFQGMLGFILNLLVGPGLVSKDMENNALPLYLCRPFSRVEYVMGKMSVVLALLSAITWIPGLLLFLLQSYLEGGGWLWGNMRIAVAIFVGSAIWILLLALLSQTVSAWVKWKMAANGVLIGIFFVPAILSQMVEEIYETKWGHIINLRALIKTIWADLFAHPSRIEIPVWSAWFSLAVIFALSLLLLTRKVRAYEVVK
jgi:ABC-2 type transport system permease protein